MKNKKIETFKDFKKQVRKDKLIVILLRSLIVIGFFVLWEVGARLGFLNVFLVVSLVMCSHYFNHI